MSNEKITDITPWLSTRIVTLPSGAKIEVCNRTMRTMMAAKLIPKTLISKVVEMETKIIDAKNDKPDIDALQDSLGEIFEFICKNFIVSPKIIVGEADRAKGEISIADVTDKDQEKILLLFKGIGGGGEPLIPFRDERGSDNAGRDVSQIQPAPIESSGN